jgi:SAM-dependent methyltransferase
MAFMIPCSFPLSRRKVVPLWVRLAYLLNRTLRILGGDALLHFWLNTAWISNRMAVESCFLTREAEFRKLGFALREESLAKWLPEGATVLDIGCGIGEWSRIASKYASRVIGTDYESEYIRRNQSNCPPNVSFILSDAVRSEPVTRLQKSSVLSSESNALAHTNVHLIPSSPARQQGRQGSRAYVRAGLVLGGSFRLTHDSFSLRSAWPM